MDKSFAKWIFVGLFAAFSWPAVGADTLENDLSNPPVEPASSGAFTGNIGMVSDYVFRGLSQTREHPALQGGIDYVHPSGLYAGIWGSTIDFNDTDNANVEVDGYIGYSRSYDKWTIDGRVTYYAYPGAKTVLDYNYYEIGTNVSYDLDVAKLTAALNYTPNNFGESGNAVYSALSIVAPLPYELNFNAKIGYQTIDDEVRFGYPSYTDWSLGITYEWEKVTFGLQYVDTNLTTAECADGCDAKGILSATYAF